MKQVILKLTTGAADGAASTEAAEVVIGKLYAILYVPGNIDTGATLTVTCTDFQSAAKPLLTKASAGTSNAWFYPRDIVHAVADGAALTGTAGGDRALPILNGRPKAVIASGDNSKTGYCILYYEA